MSKRELRSAGSTTVQTLDSTKDYKYNASGALVESTGTPAGTDIVFSGSKSSLRRIADLERNVSILAAKSLTDDGTGSGQSGDVDYAKKAGQWLTARTITLGGDLTGNVSINGAADATLTATIAANSVALGTDTTGNYMVNVSGGTGISVSHTQGEGSTATISLNATTDNVSEGLTNQYFTNARARSAVSASGSLSYNSTTGVFSFTDAVTSVAGKTGAVTLAVADVSGAASTTYVDNKVAALVAAAPAALDTLNELAAALGNDANFATTITNALAGKFSTSGGTLSGSLTVNGAITATGEITAYFSDERLKTDISPISGALDKVMAIGGYTYKANDLAHELGVSRYDNQIGLLAQEVEAVMPELVTQSGLAGYKTIRYDKVVSVLVEAIKEQQAMIEELRKDVKKTLH